MKNLLYLLAGSFFLIFFWGCGQDSSAPVNPSTIEGNGTLDQSFLEANVVATYEITLENLAPGASQPLSPPVAATHTPSSRIFHLGGFASDELRQVAEDAVNGPLFDLLNGSDQVFNVLVGSSAPIPPGHSATFTIQAENGFHMLSLVTMLVNTNDGITGVDKFNLPQQGTKEVYLRAYDAGTEENTELAAHIPGPCCNNPGVRVPTEERIRFHPGISGHGDLDPEVYGWDEPVAKLTVTRVE